MVQHIIRLWERERATYTGQSNDGDAHGLNRLVSEMLRASEDRRNALLFAIGLPRDLNSLVSLLIDDIEDGHLPMHIEACACPPDSNLLACWFIDLHEYEFWIPDSKPRLSDAQRAALVDDGRYEAADCGTFAYYVGPDRHYVAVFSPQAIMDWAGRFLERHTRALEQPLGSPQTLRTYQHALGTVQTRARNRGHSHPTRIVSNAIAISPLPA